MNSNDKKTKEMKHLILESPNAIDEIFELADNLEHEMRMLDAKNKHLSKPLQCINLTYHLRCAPENPRSELAITETSSLHHASPDIKSIKAMQHTLVKKGKVI